MNKNLKFIMILNDISCSVYEQLFETSDIMSDAFELCVGHFHFMLENFLFNIRTLDSVITNSGHFDLPRPFAPLQNLTICRTICPTF